MRKTQGPVRVGLPFSAYYRVNRVGQRKYHLERLTRLAFANMRPTDHPWPGGTQVEVRLTVFEADGRLLVGSVQVITAPELIETPYGLLSPPVVEPLAVGADLMRLVPVGLLADEAIRAVAEDAPWSHDLDDEPEARARLESAVTSGAVDTPRRGRRPSLTPELLEVVATAYRAGGGSPVRSVQAALTDDPRFRGSGSRGEATRDQAAKAVAAARAAHLLPEARRDAR